MAGEDITEAIAIYDPNGPMAMIAFIVFLLVAVGFWYRHFRYETPRPRYMRPIRYGATFMALGYLCRFTRRNGINAWSWLFETLFILLSPCAFLAQVYLLLPKLATSLDAQDSLPLGGKAIKWIFILADITTVLAQLAGTALTITFGDLVKIGKWIVTGALWVQLLFFLTFMGLFLTFRLRINRQHKTGSGKKGLFRNCGAVQNGIKWNARWTSLVCAMLAASGFMLIRSIYRVAEYTSGANSALAYSETAFYILDSLMMLLLIGSFHVVWPPMCFEVLETTSRIAHHDSSNLSGRAVEEHRMREV